MSANLAFDAFDLEEIQEEINGQRNLRRTQEIYIQPQTITEEKLAEIWSSILHIEPIGIRDDFFKLGGHSLTATQVLAQVNRFFEIDIPVSVLFSQEEFTVEQLAQLVDQYRLEQANEEELSALLADLDGLSEEEIEAILYQTKN